MTTRELKRRVSVQRAGYGQYEVTITYYGKQYTCHSNNSLAWDRLDDDDYPDNFSICGYTNREVASLL